jgi:hypothetical protein
VIAAIARTAISARMSAYSANPWPRCPLGTMFRTELMLTLRSTSTSSRQTRRAGTVARGERFPI